MTDKNPRQPLGQRGEEWVAGWLCGAGYTILDRNWRYGAEGELDIVARQGNEIVFVEVRTRRGPLQEAITWALESVGARKRDRLVRLAQAYLVQHHLDDMTWRIDVAAVGCEGGRLSIEVIHNAADW
jgi:putative endonuclease